MATRPPSTGPEVNPPGTGPVYGPPLPTSDPLPGDVHASWGGLMRALGQGLPYHPNRAVTVTRAMRRVVSR